MGRLGFEPRTKSFQFGGVSFHRFAFRFKFSLFVALISTGRGYARLRFMIEYPRADSPFVWLKWQDPKTGKPAYKSTKVRWDHPKRTELVARIVHRIEGKLLDARERQGDGAAGGDACGWAAWVPGWIATTYGRSPGTLNTYRLKWAALARWLHSRHIHRPQAIRREDAFAYPEWRAAARKGKAGKTITRNTAIQELKLLALILEEAVRRNWLETNPLRRLGLRRDETAPKPELTDEDIGKIRAAFVNPPAGIVVEPWMPVAWEIALHTGLRHAETRLRLADVDFVGEEIHIAAPKGGRARAFSIPLPPELMPTLRRLREQRRAWAWDGPKHAPLASLVWRRFFNGIELPDVTFHCTRVTFITRGMRAGIAERVMRELVNHAGSEVHRIYQRVRRVDLREARARIMLPPALPAAPPAA